MAGVARLAQAMGYGVSGCDENVYPPMSDQLAEAGIEIMQGYEPQHLEECNGGRGADLVLVGNAMSRGNPVVEAVLNRGLKYTSGPQWLSECVLQDRWVLAIAGTHGKTTASSMLAWILEANGLQPGYLIGGVPGNFGISARLGEAPFFVIEADEYDTAFFDKRSKFVHYRPRTLVLNNLEFDHADIFTDLAAIQRQFHHLLRTVPGDGKIIVNHSDSNLLDVIEQGCWSDIEWFSALASESNGWRVSEVDGPSREFSIYYCDKSLDSGYLELPGEHNRLNALAAIAAARHAGVRPQDAVSALKEFRGVKRRLEVFAEVNGITIYDDFAHHPTAISATLSAILSQTGSGRVLALLEPRSNTMRMGLHDAELRSALQAASLAWVYQSTGADAVLSLQQKLEGVAVVADNLDTIVKQVAEQARPGDHIVLMSNGGFDNAHLRLLKRIKQASG